MRPNNVPSALCLISTAFGPWSYTYWLSYFQSCTIFLNVEPGTPITRSAEPAQGPFDTCNQQSSLKGVQPCRSHGAVTEPDHKSGFLCPTVTLYMIILRHRSVTKSLWCLSQAEQAARITTLF